MNDLIITLIQSNLHWEDKNKNLQMFTEKLSSLKEQTDIVILPEMFTTGFSMNASTLAETMDGPTIKWMKKTAREKNCIITGSIIIEDGGKFYNRLFWMSPQEEDYYDKRHLFSLAEEEKTFHAGKRKIIKNVKGWKILPLICYDLRFPVWSRRTNKSDYDLLIYVANWPDKRIHAWKQLLIARAIENQSYVAGVNRVGRDGNEIFYSGHSAVIDFKGDALTNVREAEESMITLTLSASEKNEHRKHFAFFNDRDDFEIKT